MHVKCRPSQEPYMVTRRANSCTQSLYHIQGQSTRQGKPRRCRTVKFPQSNGFSNCEPYIRFSKSKRRLHEGDELQAFRPSLRCTGEEGVAAGRQIRRGCLERFC